MGGELKEKARPFLIKWTGDPKQGLTKTCRWPRQTNYLVFLQQPGDITDLSSAACGAGWWQIAVPGLHAQLSRTKALQGVNPTLHKGILLTLFCCRDCHPYSHLNYLIKVFFTIKPNSLLKEMSDKWWIFGVFFPHCVTFLGNTLVPLLDCTLGSCWPVLLLMLLWYQGRKTGLYKPLYQYYINNL